MNSKDVNNLIEKLTAAEHAYYVLNKPIMSDGEYDKLFNELKKIELENPDLVFAYSPTQRVTGCLLYTSPSPRDGLLSRMPSSA